MINWKGLTNYQAKLRKSPDKLRTKSIRDVEIWRRNVAAQTAIDAPVDLGKLRQSVNNESIDNGLGGRVSVNAPYAAFIEFGTGAGILIPPGWEEVAAKFRGSGQRKVTIKAHSYFIPNVRSEGEKLKNRLRYNLRTLLQ